MRSRKSSILLWEPQIQPVLHLCVWVERGLFFPGWISWGWKQFLSFSHIAKHSTCVQFWISTKLAVLNQWAGGVPKVHLQVCLAQWVHFPITTMSQIEDGFPRQPAIFNFSSFNKYLLKTYQEPDVGRELVGCCWGKPDAILGFKGLIFEVGGQTCQWTVFSHSITHLIINLYGAPTCSKPEVPSGDTVVSEWWLQSNDR